MGEVRNDEGGCLDFNTKAVVYEASSGYISELPELKASALGTWPEYGLDYVVKLLVAELHCHERATVNPTSAFHFLVLVPAGKCECGVRLVAAAQCLKLIAGGQAALEQMIHDKFKSRGTLAANDRPGGFVPNQYGLARPGSVFGKPAHQKVGLLAWTRERLLDCCLDCVGGEKRSSRTFLSSAQRMAEARTCFGNLG